MKSDPASLLKRIFTRAPDRAKTELPSLFHRNPRLDPVRVIAKQAASVDWRLYSKRAIRKNGDSADPIDDHELYELLQNPCPTFQELDGWVLRYLTFAHVELVGEFFWLKVRDQRGRIISLMPIPGAWVVRKPTVADHLFLIYPYGVTASTALTVLAEDVVWFKDVDLNDPYANGRGATEAIADEAETDEYAAKYQKNIMFNDGNPPYAVLLEQGTEQTVKQLKKGFIEKIAGFMHAREPMVLTGKGVAIQKLGSTPMELDLIESRKFIRDLSLQHYQIPPEIYGIIENSNRATIDSAFYLMGKNVVAPRLQFFERVVTSQLCYEFDADLCFVHEQIVPEDEDFALKVYSEGLKNRAITINEWRTRFRLPEVPGGDVFTAPISLTTVPMNEPAQPKPEPAKPEPIPEDTVLEIEEPKMLKILDDPETESRKNKQWAMFDAKAVSVEEPFRASVHKISKVQRGKVQDSVKAAIRSEQSQDAIDSALKFVFTPATDKAVKQTIAPAWMEGLRAGRDHADELLGNQKAIKEDDSVYNEWFNKWVEKAGLLKAKEINDTTHEALRRALAEELAASIEDGDGLRAMIDRLMTACDGVYDNMDKARAELIARTESAASVNAGTMATYSIEGVKKIEWLAVRDSRTRDDHSAIDGTIIKTGDKFQVGPDSMEYPGDPSASAGNVCNCRCTLAPVIE